LTDKRVFPFVSVLIPIRNEGSYISQCLQAVSQQDYSSDLFEILISDGLSTDNTRAIVAEWMKNDPRIRLFDNPKQIVPTGMNILIPQAKGEILIRVDGHCVIAPDYISNCVLHLKKDSVDGVGGSMHSIGEDLVSQVTALAMSSKFGVGNSSFRTETGQTKLADTVPFPAYTREIIQRAGLYDEELVRNQDDEYNYRIREMGGKILLAEDVRSTYYSRGSLAKLWKQYFQYGYWKVRVLQKHPRQMSLRQFVPLAFVLALILTLFLSFLVSWGRLALLILFVAYIAPNLAASIVSALGQGAKKLLLLPLAFAIIHFSYGLGFLVGLFKFWNRWQDNQGSVPNLGDNENRC